jgi:hypothetical protein
VQLPIIWLREQIVRTDALDLGALIPEAFPMVQDTRTARLIEEKALAVLPYLPAVFTTHDLLEHAIGLNVVGHASEIEQMVTHLVACGAICRLGPNIAMWARAESVGRSWG